MNRQRGSDDDWCILRTSGSQTLALAASLRDAGFDAWAPKRTVKQFMRGVKVRKGVARPTVEVDVPVLPTYVFARWRHLGALIVAAADRSLPHPSFSVFQFAGRAPEIRDRDIVGLQEEERAAADLIVQLRECEDRQERDRIRIAAMRTEKARRKALRAELRNFEIGAKVHVLGRPAFAGVTGVIERSDGRSAVVAFGKVLMHVEAWQLIPHGIMERDIAA